jgi:hypothetical protein
MRTRPFSRCVALLCAVAVLLGGCEPPAKKERPAGSKTQAPAVPNSSSVPGNVRSTKIVPTTGSQDGKEFLMPDGRDIFDLTSHPDAIVVAPLDPATLTESEQKYGRSPHPDPKVEYQPGIILMEEGHKAIRSFSSDGLIWAFDANAPHVNEFQEGKIVFATSRAVGKILYMKRQGDTVSVVLGPIQIMDVIRKGSFAMHAPLDLSKVLPFITPAYPQTKDNDSPNNVSEQTLPGPNDKQTIVFSRISPSGKWTPISMAKISGDGSRVAYQRVGTRWVSLSPESALALGTSPVSRTEEHLSPYRMPASRSVIGSHRQNTGGRPRLVRTAYDQVQMPGTGLNVPMVPYMPDIDVPPIGMPPLNLTGYLNATPVGTWNSIGVKYSYERRGVGLTATAIVKFDGAQAGFFLDVGKDNGPPIECGIEISATVSLHIQMKAHTVEEFHISGQQLQKFWLPTSFSIPLTGNVPLAVNFDQAVVFNTGFSAKNAVLDAEGEYVFTGGIKAGYFNNGFHVQIPTSVSAKTDIAKSAQGVSVGINSLIMSAEFRATAGLGAAGFATGVYASLVYSGTILRAPDIGLPCRRGTIEGYLTPGLGYSIPGWLTDAINFVLSALTTNRVDKAGSFLQGERIRLFHGDSSIPGNCATPKGGG